MSAIRCKSCGSPAPHLHPAAQFEGEVSICADEFHLQDTPQARPHHAAVIVAREAIAARQAGSAAP